MKSIRANLLLWLIGALTLASAMVLMATYTFAQEELGRVFDEELRKIALAVHMREDWREEGNVRVARPEFVFVVRAYDGAGRVYFENVLTSRPFDVPKTFEPGFSNVETPEGAWRLYTHVTLEGIVQAAQPQETRAALARELSLRLMLPFLLLIPLLAILLAWVLKRALVPLDETSRRVRERDATRLDLLPSEGVPRELLPLVAQINGLLARLSASLEAQRGFFADAAHELRSPVSALTLQAQLAERAQLPEVRAAAFAELKGGIARAGRLVEQLLDLARLEPGVQAEPPAPVDVAQLVRDIVGECARRAEALGVDLGADTPRSATVLGAGSELRSLIRNLVDNALRYAPRESDITVSVAQRPSAIEVSVADRGPGIPRAERERVFERFQRVAGDTTHGSGLGLPIAKAIVERHGGTIALDDAYPGSEPPGLAVRVTLPAGG